MSRDMELEDKAFNWCRKFLGGTWAECSSDKFKITPIRGALTNYIYTCELDSSVSIKDQEFRKVILRIYGEISGPHEKFCEMIIFNILSERKMGPRLLGAFKGGRIEQYFESVPLSVFELRVESYSIQIARKMARYHLLEVPINKQPSFVSRFVSRYTKYFYQAVDSKSDMSPRSKEIIEKIISMDVVHEFETLQKALEKNNPVIAFCHNDVQEANLLVLSNKTIDQESREILLIDYEYSYYGYRGFDIGNHFCEWMLENVSDKPLGFDYDANSYPNNHQQLIFANSYIDSINRELKDAVESKRQYFLTTPLELLKESNQHSLMSHLLWGFWGIAQHFLSKIEFDFLEYSIVRFELYFHFKQLFYPN